MGSSPSDPRTATRTNATWSAWSTPRLSPALIADLERLSKEAPDAKRHAGNFEPVEAVKPVYLDPSNDASEKVRIGSELDPK
jgi:hypothetical protein